MPPLIRVTGVRVLDDYRLEVSFSTGDLRLFDVRPYLDKGIFTELRDAAYFRTVRLAFGSIAWPHGQDFGPESLFAESQVLSRSAVGSAHSGLRPVLAPRDTEAARHLVEGEDSGPRSH